MSLFGSIPGGRTHDPIISTRTGIVVRTGAINVPLKWIVLGNLFRGLGWLIKRYFRHWRITLPLTGFAYVGLHYGWPMLVALVVVLASSGTAWWWLYRASFLRWMFLPVKATFRRASLVRIFAPTMVTSGLSVHYQGVDAIPSIVKVRCRPLMDIVTVRVLSGQVPTDFAEQAERLAHAFGVRQVKVKEGPEPRLVVLHLHHGDPLTEMVAPLPVAEVPDLAALPMARHEDGSLWTLRLRGNHVLIVGATDSGKGSAAWSFVRALAGGISSGLVKLWAFDPKGGMELAAGEPMYDRFLYGSPEDMANCLDEAVGVMQARTEHLRGRTRQHVATIADPTLVLLVDELATLTAYITDRQLKDRIKNSLAQILTKGRAAGVHVFALVQDGRKEVVPFRNLFTVRVGLRLAEASEVDLVLGDGARDRGALCDQIAHSTPGVAYVIDSGTPTPERIRFSYLTDADIDAMAADYPRHGVITGYVVGDLEVKK